MAYFYFLELPVVASFLVACFAWGSSSLYSMWWSIALTVRGGITNCDLHFCHFLIKAVFVKCLTKCWENTFWEERRYINVVKIIFIPVLFYPKRVTTFNSHATFLSLTWGAYLFKFMLICSTVHRGRIVIMMTLKVSICTGLSYFPPHSEKLPPRTGQILSTCAVLQYASAPALFERARSGTRIKDNQLF